MTGTVSTATASAVDAAPDLRPAAGPPIPTVVLVEEAARHAAVAEKLRADTSVIEAELSAAAGPAASVPTRRGDWWYVLRRGRGGRAGSSMHRFPVVDPDGWTPPRPPGPPVEQLVHDPAAPPGSPAHPVPVGSRVVGPDGRLLAFCVDRHGDERFDVLLRDLSTGVDHQLAAGKGPAVVFAPDGSGLYCVDVDDLRRPWRVVRVPLPGPDDRPLGSTTTSGSRRDAVEVIGESDPQVTVGVHGSRSGQFVFVTVQTPAGTEVIVVEGPDGPRSDVLVPRAAGRQVVVDHVCRADGRADLLVLERGRTDRVRVLRWGGGVPGDDELPVHDPDPHPAEPIIVPPPDRRILGVLPFRGFDVVTTAGADGSISHRFHDPDGRLTYATAGSMILSGNDDPDAPTARFVAADHLRPPRTLEIGPDGTIHDRSAGSRDGVPEIDATVETITARSVDGTAVAVTVLRPAGSQSSGPAVLIGYGAYGVALRPLFDPTRLPLLSRGIPVALAHVRGGGEGGPAWHAAGTGAGKIDAVHDFLACAAALVEHGIAAPGRILATGASAGGTLVAAALNEDPTPFAVALLDLPFVDPLGTMSDPDLPFTVRDRREWGDPIADPAARAVLQAYSPLQNVRRQAYPPVWCTAAVHDVRVPLAGPVRWARAVRRLGTAAAPVVLDIRREDGHAASTATTPGTALRLAWALAVLQGRTPTPAPDSQEVPT